VDQGADARAQGNAPGTGSKRGVLPVCKLRYPALKRLLPVLLTW
jgi:hypothetical protein